MDRKLIRRLLTASCCANVILCILIIIHLKSYSSRFNPSQKRFTKKPQDFSKNGIIRSDSFYENKFHLRSALNGEHFATMELGKQSNSNNSISDKGEKENLSYNSNFVTGYDPSFGIYFHTRLFPKRHLDELSRKVIPNSVFYIWCGSNVFSFKHFLSIFSIWYHLEPDVIEIRYELPPLEDKYNTWLSWLRTNIPALSVQPLPSYVTGQRCGSFVGLEYISDVGGLYVSNDAILYSHSRDDLIAILSLIRSFSFYPDGTLAWAVSTAGDHAIKRYLMQSDWRKNTTQPKIYNFKSFSSAIKFNCTDQEILSNVLETKSQLNTPLKSSLYEPPAISQLSHSVICNKFEGNIHPVDILQSKSGSIGNKFADMLYMNRNTNNNTNNNKNNNNHNNNIQISNYENSNNSTNTTDNKNEDTSMIPNIIHYIWFGRQQMTFSMYLSFLSSTYVAKPDAIFIHSDLQLYGIYWDLVAKHPLVRLVLRKMPHHIFTHRILYTQHRSDIVRADILDKYGGIYLDWDVFWLKSPLDLLKTNYDIILARDHIPRPPFPDTINMGVALAKPRSKFIQAWRSAWLNYKSLDFLYNAVELPYKIYEMFPEQTFLHDRLQVMCYFLKCHPLFHPDHKNWGQSQPFDWARDVYSIHFTHPDPPAFHNETALKQGQGMFADMGRYIWNLGQYAAVKELLKN